MAYSISIRIIFFSLLIITYATENKAAEPKIKVFHTSPNLSNPSFRNSCQTNIIGRIKAVPPSGKIHILMYTLGSDAILGALTAAAERGVNVCILLDKGQYYEQEKSRSSSVVANQTAIKALNSHGLRKSQVRLYGSLRSSGADGWKTQRTLHEKLALFKGDQYKLFMGSYNWTWGADALNYENCIFMESSEDPDIKEIINGASTRFDTLWQDSSPLVGSAVPLEGCFVVERGSPPPTVTAVVVASSSDSSGKGKREGPKPGPSGGPFPQKKGSEGGSVPLSGGRGMGGTAKKTAVGGPGIFSGLPIISSPVPKLKGEFSMSPSGPGGHLLSREEKEVRDLPDNPAAARPVPPTTGRRLTGTPLGFSPPLSRGERIVHGRPAVDKEKIPKE